MKYNMMCGEKVSALGFGLMRLPLNEDKSIDQEQVQKMVDYAMEHGINYYDTAWPYHNGKSELSIAEAMAKYPRESYFLANKYPGHQHMDEHDVAKLFEKQLKKCNVDYFDFYLFHNVCENSFDTYKDERWGIIDYLVEQKKQGRIKHLGLSTHASAANLPEILDYFGDNIEFCQIQLNYIDWTLQDGKDKVEELNKRGIPMVIMESVRGGKLADLGEENNAKLKAERPDASVTSWALKWLQQVEGVSVILSGMSAYDQMTDNVNAFEDGVELTEAQCQLLMDIADAMKVGAPCTACRYCCEGCPMGLDIPTLIAGYNDLKFQYGFTVPMQMEALPEEKLPSACIGCGACSQICPQHIDIPAVMEEFSDLLKANPSWAKICKERAAVTIAMMNE